MNQQSIIEKGKLLIAEPFLPDRQFSRTIILLCEHEIGGSLGFVINRATDEKVEMYIPEFEGTDFTIYYGGPVEMDRLHFLHCCPDLINGGTEIIDGIYWGGDFETAKELVQEKQISEKQIRFFLGYAGWEKEQLNRELEEQSWIIAGAEQSTVFDNEGNSLWRRVLTGMGGDYAIMANFPIAPELN